MRLLAWLAALLLVIALAGAAWMFARPQAAIPFTGASPSPAPTAIQSGTDPIVGIVPELVTSMPPAVATLAAEIIPTLIPEDQTVLLAVGDIATCSRENDNLVADLAKSLPGSVLLLGDNVYERGTSREYINCFDPAWGSIKDRLMPSPGNHEYRTSGASGYYQYFGMAAGDSSQGWYSFDAGDWHIISLNSNCDELEGGCQAGSPQETWLKADLAANPAKCTLAYWHHPRFSSGDHGNNTEVQPLWETLYAAGVEVVLNGHDHNYERFAPQTPGGQADQVSGIRQFVVGTGGKSLRGTGRAVANSEVRDASTYGLLKLTLFPDRFSWEFVATSGGNFSDSGQGTCH